MALIRRKTSRLRRTSRYHKPIARYSSRPTFALRAIPMRHHDDAPVLGARFEVEGRVFAFTGDTMPTDAVIELARDADLLAHDANFKRHVEPGTRAGRFRA